MKRLFVSSWSLFLLVVASPVVAIDVNEVNPDDHICIIGNALAERMQHDGWLEARLQARFPNHRLVIRNLGYGGDEVTVHFRSANFGSRDDHLRINQADIILAFFGYNESFAGESGLDKFKQDLADFIKHTKSQNYNYYNSPQLVIFSPIAHEDLNDRNLPDGQANNERLAMYSQAMKEVAEANKVQFVDLFEPTQAAYEANSAPLTINGIHLNTAGNQRVAEIIDGKLFNEASSAGSNRLEDIRQAVLDKNFHWYHRHRTTDGFSVYGGRSTLRFEDSQTNREVVRRELQILDMMTANRDRKIWAAANGQDLEVTDDNLPPLVTVKSNKPGPLPGGKHVFLSGDEAIEKMTISEGMQVNLFASEEMFPELVNPVQIAWDTQNRLWVAAWPTYPHWTPTEEMNDKLLILEDTDGDGRADKCKTFAGDLHNPTGFEFWNGGVLVAMAPDLLFLKDTDGDDVADVRQRVLHGIDSADTHHTINSFVIDPGGALYMQEGTFHHTQVETPWEAAVRSANAGVFRFEPRTFQFDVYVARGFANPHGHVFDRWGNDIVHDGTGAVPFHGALFSGHTDFPRKHPQPPTLYNQRTRPCSGTEILSSGHFPDELQGNLLVLNVIGFQGILQYKVEPKGASFIGTEIEPILYSSDPNFRPTDIEVGPDGAIYFGDWMNPIIGHMQHNLRDPNRDREHGRIYRVTYPSRELLSPPKIAGESIAHLLDLLKDSGDRVRYRARLELTGRDSEQVIAAAKEWMANLDQSDPDYEHHMLEGLWLHQSHNVVNEALLKRMLSSQDHRARAAATRVLCYWRDRVTKPLDLLAKLAADEHPLVRLEAVRACSFFRENAAAEAAFASLEHPTDEYLEFVLQETMKTLEPHLTAE